MTNSRSVTITSVWLCRAVVWNMIRRYRTTMTCQYSARYVTFSTLMQPSKLQRCPWLCRNDSRCVRESQVTWGGIYITSKPCDCFLQTSWYPTEPFQKTIHCMNAVPTVSIPLTIHRTSADCRMVDSGLNTSFAVVACSEAPWTPLFYLKCWRTSSDLLAYEYAITLAREIELFWNRPRRSWPFVLFIANRYINVFGHILYFITAFHSLKGSNDKVGCTHYTERRFTTYSDILLQWCVDSETFPTVDICGSYQVQVNASM